MRNPAIRVGVLVLVSAAGLATAAAEDWPQWQGSHRDAVWTDGGVIDRFPASGPKIKWRAKVAGGYAGPAVADGRVFVPDYVRTKGEAVADPGQKPRLEGEERLVCLDEATGNELWTHRFPRTYEISYPAGPRATPTVDGERVYFLGAEGNLKCLDVKTGDVVWEHDLKAEYQAPTPIWGFCAHPLVDGDRLYVTAGGEGSIALCLDKKTGEEIWRSLSAKDAGYCPPTMIEVGGTKELLIWTPQALNSLNPKDGSLNWSVPLEPSYGMSIVAPAQSGSHLFAGGITDVGVMLTLNPGGAPKEAWRSSKQLGFGPVHSPAVYVGDYLYGIDREGELTCVEVSSGKRLWQTYAVTTGTRRAGSATAFLTRNGDHFYIFTETGDLVIAKLSPEKYEEISRAHVIDPTHEAFGRTVVWSAPAFANGCAFVRNDKEIVCVDLTK